MISIAFLVIGTIYAEQIMFHGTQIAEHGSCHVTYDEECIMEHGTVLADDD